MVLSYNFILHCPVLVLNTAIIIKEFSLESFQLLTGANDNYSLGYADLETGIKDFLWFLNPFTIVDLFLSVVYWFGEKILEIIFHSNHPNLRH
jgi:hypothetical protein